MRKVFLINGQAAFHTAQNLLVSLEDAEKSQTLNEPCARCLEALLEAKGEVVSHDTLYQTAWADSHSETSPNTLYQNILLARKALKAVTKSEEDFILTVPRKGFSFNSEIPVTQQEETLPEVKEANVMSESTAIMDVVPRQTAMLRERFKNLSTITFCLMIVVSLVLLSLVGYRYFQSVGGNIDDEYTFYQDIAGCHIYFRPNSSLPSIDGDSLLKQYPELTAECESLPYRYISPFLKPERVFSLSCNKKENPGRICTATYIRNLP
jgi:DNA-binding winged helix-turn-helix (wHTH) protein